MWKNRGHWIPFNREGKQGPRFNNYHNAAGWAIKTWGQHNYYIEWHDMKGG